MPQLSKPAPGGSGFRAAEHVGALVVFVGTKLEPDYPTSFGTTNAARVAITVPLDGENAGEVYYDSLLFQTALVPSLTNAESDIVVGRIGVGQAKAGQSAPYILDEPTEEEITAVQTWLDENIIEKTPGIYALSADEKPFE